MTLRHIIDIEGYLEIESGVYLNSREHLIEQQKWWVDEDKCKTFDFNDYEYWITTEGETVPDGVNSIEEGLLTIIGIDTCRKFTGDL